MGLFTLKGLNKRRWELFKANRRGLWSLWIFGALFLMSVFAPVIGNDRRKHAHQEKRPEDPQGPKSPAIGLEQLPAPLVQSLQGKKPHGLDLARFKIDARIDHHVGQVADQRHHKAYQGEDVEIGT